MARRRPRGLLRRLLVFGFRLLALLLVATVAATLVLRWVPPVTSSMMVQRRVEAWVAGERYVQHYDWAGWDRIAPYAAVAAVAAEDQKFASHRGFDVESISDALAAHERGRRLRGASTISQQLAKNLFLWPGRSFLRKGLEAYFTSLIESLWPKRRILEVYLNVAEFGNGVFGVEAASQRFFGKPAARLTPEEAALLAAVLPNPRRFRADRPSPYVLDRRAWILRQMQQLGGRAYVERL